MQSLPDPNPKPPHPQLLSSGIKSPSFQRKRNFLIITATASITAAITTTTEK